MTREQKDLLLKDLCARLPYNIKVQYKGNIFNIDYISPIYGEIHLDIVDNYTIDVSEIKPYLFPLSSMTNEQYDEFFNYFHNIEIEEIKASGDYLKAAYLSDSAKYEWLNRNKFDWGYLIEKGLAIDATDLNVY